MKFLMLLLVSLVWSVDHDQAMKTIKELEGVSDHMVFAKELHQIGQTWTLPQSAHLDEQTKMIESLSGDISKNRFLESINEVATIFNQRNYRQRYMVNDFLKKVKRLDYQKKEDLEVIKADLMDMVEAISKNPRMKEEIKKLTLSSFDDAKWTLENTTLLSFPRIKEDLLKVLSAHIPQKVEQKKVEKEKVEPSDAVVVNNVAPKKEESNQAAEPVVEKKAEVEKQVVAQKEPVVEVQKTVVPKKPMRKKSVEVVEKPAFSFEYVKKALLSGNKKVLSYVILIPLILGLLGFIFLSKSKKEVVAHENPRTIKHPGEEKKSILDQVEQAMVVVVDGQGRIVEYNPAFRERFFSFIGEHGNWLNFFQENFRAIEGGIFSFKDHYFQISEQEKDQYLIYHLNEEKNYLEKNESVSKSETFDFKNFVQSYLSQRESLEAFPQGLKLSSESHFINCHEEHIKEMRNSVQAIFDIVASFQKAKGMNRGEVCLSRSTEGIGIEVSFKKVELTQKELGTIESIDGKRHLIDLLKSLKNKSTLQIASKVKSLKSSNGERTIFSFQIMDPESRLTKRVHLVGNS